MSEKRFHQQVAIITGAGQGIGFEIASQLAQEGASVVLNDVNEALAIKAARLIEQKKGICLPVAGDAADAAFNRRMVDLAVKEFGKLDIAIANAGVTLYGSFLNYSEKDFQRVVNVNLGGTFFLAQSAAHQMKGQGRGGKILFMSSVTGHRAHKDLVAYGMTKAGIEMLARALVVELSPYKININSVAPGATLTERTTSDVAYEKTWSTLTPMGRPATAHDIAHAALFLVSKQADHITGQTIIVDGGWTSVSPSV